MNLHIIFVQGHANIPCIVPIFIHVLLKRAQVVFLTINLVIEYVFNLLAARNL